MKYFFLLSAPLFLFAFFSNPNISKNQIQGLWKTKGSNFLIKFTQDSCYSFHKDSSISKGIIGPYFMEGDYVQIVWHSLEQTHLKIKTINDSAFTANRYFHRPTRKEIITGASKKVRLRINKRNLNFIKIKN